MISLGAAFDRMSLMRTTEFACDAAPQIRAEMPE